MHELSIALAILDLAEEEAGALAGGRVVAVHLKLGALSGVDREALLSAYGLAREQSPLSGAELVIEEVPVRAWCPSCGAERGVASPWELNCSVCGTPAERVVAGRELEVVALEVES
jgi:hydrogenase nickel incorporation protein HypA/HybF